MHPEAFAFVAKVVRQHGPFGTVVEYGGLNINGSVRALFPDADYVSVDPVAGPGVDIVGDATIWNPKCRFAVAACLEVLEHVPNPDEFITAAWRHLYARGRLILTMATDPRAPHSAADGGLLRVGEHYANITPEALKRWLADWDDVDIEVHPSRGDLYGTAVKPDG